MTEPCLFCRADTRPYLDDVVDNRFGAPGSWNVRACDACGGRQTSPRPDGATLKRLYEAHYNYGGKTDRTYSNAREKFLFSPFYKLLLALDGDISFHGRMGTGRLLDIGCNEGRGLALYTRNGFAAEGLELNANAAAIARARGFTVHEKLVEDFEPAEKYDVAVLSNVLEHTLDPRDALAHVKRILKPGGQVWISLPNVDSALAARYGRAWVNWHVPFHIVHFSRDRLARLLTETGFEIVESKAITPALWVAQSWIAHRWRDDLGAVVRLQRNAPLVAAAMLVARGLLFPLLAWWNRTGRGDCLIFRAKSR